MYRKFKKRSPKGLEQAGSFSGLGLAGPKTEKLTLAEDLLENNLERKGASGERTARARTSGFPASELTKKQTAGLPHAISLISKTFAASSVLLIFALIINIFPARIPQENNAPQDHRINSEKILNRVAARQVPFIQNIGQREDKIKYYSQFLNGNFAVEENGHLHYNFGNHTIQEKFSHAKKIVPQAENQTPTSINHFIGKDRAKWKKNVPNFHTVNLGEVFEGVNVKIKAFGNNIEKIFTVRPEANPSNIQIKVDGIQELTINSEGQLEMESEKTLIAMSKPIAYQEINGQKQYVEAAYKNLGNNSYGFQIGTYNSNQPLIIDPVIASTYIGGSNGNDNYPAKPDVAVNAQDKIFVVGTTTSTDFPLGQASGAVTSNGGNGDIFVARYNSSLSNLEAFTYVGGTGTEGQNGLAIALDSNSNVYITGDTTSSDFPVSNNAYQTSLGGNSDAFLVKLDSNLSALSASTFVGGSNNDFSYGIAVDSNEFVYLAGQTFSSDFPTTSGSFQTTTNDSSNGNAFITVLKLNNTGGNDTSLAGSTFVGGSKADVANDLKIVTTDTIKNIFVTGQTFSSDFPTTSGSFQTTTNDSSNGDAFVTVLKFNNLVSSVSMSASTFLGGSEYDSGAALTVDASNNIYVTGATFSTNAANNFRTTAGVYGQTSLTLNASSLQSIATGDAFVSKLAWDSNNALSLSASTFLGGTNYDAGTAVLVDTNQNIYVAGITASTDFPITNNAVLTRNAGYNDVFAAKLSNNLSSLSAGTFLGGSAIEYNINATFDTAQNLIFIGGTGSRNIPVTAGAYQTSIPNSAFQDGFLAKVTNDLTGSGAGGTGTAGINNTSTTGGGNNGTGPNNISNTTGFRAFTNIPDNTSFADGSAGDFKYSNSNGPDSADMLAVTDLKNDASSGFEVHLTASAFQTTDKSQSIGLENLYVVTTMPRLPGDILDVANGMEYTSNCQGSRNIKANVSADSVMLGVTGYNLFNNYTIKGSNFGNGVVSKPVVLMTAPPAARRCTMLEYVSYALKLPNNVQPGTYSVTLTFTLL